MKRNTIIAVVVLLVVSIALFAVWKNTQTRAKYRGPLQKVTLQLKWLHQAQFAGFYAAAQEGFYKDEGLDVTIQPIGQDLSEGNVINRVDSGEVQFAVVGGDKVISARSEGKQIKAVAVIFQQSPVVLATLQSSGIKNLRDLVGKKIAIEKGQNTETIYRAMMNRAGVDTRKVKEVTVPLGLAPLAKGQADARMIYLINEALEYSKNGFLLNMIYPEDYDIQIYADTLVTSDKLINSNPDLVQRFVRASLKGWNWSIVNPIEAGQLSLKYNPQLFAVHEDNMMEAELPLVYTGKISIGGMDPAIWSKMVLTLLEEHLIKNKVRVEDIFTTQFLQP